VFRRYWPKISADRHVTVASRRSLSGFCLLAGVSGILVTIANAKYFQDSPLPVALGAVATLVCLLAPVWVNARGNFEFRARLVGLFMIAMLTALALMNGRLVIPSNLLLVPGVMTYTLAVGWRTGLGFLVTTLAIYSWSFANGLAPGGDDMGGYLFTLFVAMVMSAVFVFAGATIFRREMLKATDELEQARQAAEDAVLHFRERATTDALTGMANRASFDQALDREFEHFQASEQPFSLIIFDLDHFKRINDTYGHVAGDRILVETARVISRTVRICDTVGRIGGEEFAVILPESDEAAAVELAERMRQAIAGLRVQIERRGEVSVTASFGVAECAASDTAVALVERADQLLYRAKRQGRDRVEAAHTISRESLDEVSPGLRQA
jgi:diguanylate cyclase (GGDEF)-like protein